MASTSDERKFVTFQRRQIRDSIILRGFRNQLRSLIDPETGVEFTEDRITEITQRGSRFYIEADGIDLYGMSSQQRARWMANQLRPKWASTNFLDDVHGELWLGEDARLPATGGSGEVTATGTGGSIFPGSPVIGTASAAVAVDPNGKKFQVLQTAQIPVGETSVTLKMKCISTGSDTNPVAGTIFTWSVNEPPGADPEFAVLSDFSGGVNVETDSEFADRIEQTIRFRPASGNNAHFVTWARQSSAAVESAYVYANAWNAGSVLVCILQKRGTSTGPNARTNPAPGTLIAARNYLVPPASPVVPERAYVVVIPPAEQPADVAIKLALGFGTDAGWADQNPWPLHTTAYPSGVKVTSVTSNTQFSVTTDSDLPGGASSLSGNDVPTMMLWNEADSVWEKLQANLIVDSGTIVAITLSQEPSFNIAVGQTLCPYTEQYTVIQDTLEKYFDELGPGEVVDLATDPRAIRAFRFPPITQGANSRAGETVITRLIEALGGVLPDGSLEYISRNTPDIAADPIDGPNIITLGEAGVYPI
jgi:uncharacterized phage protein gp47/JayE